VFSESFFFKTACFFPASLESSPLPPLYPSIYLLASFLKQERSRKEAGKKQERSRLFSPEPLPLLERSREAGKLKVSAKKKKKLSRLEPLLVCACTQKVFFFYRLLPLLPCFSR
jgi:hypothetical protein